MSRIGLVGGKRRQVGRRAVGMDALRKSSGSAWRGRHPDRGGGRGQSDPGEATAGRSTHCPGRRNGQRRQNVRAEVRSASGTGTGWQPLGPMAATAVLASSASMIARRSFTTALPSLSATVWAPKLTSSTSPRGISHSPNTSWVSISGTSKVTFCTLVVLACDSDPRRGCPRFWCTFLQRTGSRGRSPSVPLLSRHPIHSWFFADDRAPRIGVRRNDSPSPWWTARITVSSNTTLTRIP